MVPLQSLNPYNETWTVKAKVISKSAVRTFNTQRGEGKVASMDIVDEQVRPPTSFPACIATAWVSGTQPCLGWLQGTSMGVTMWREFVDRHYAGIEEGKVYFITRGSVKPANKKYASTRNDYEMHLDGRTSIEESADQDTSSMVAKLEVVPIEALTAHVGKKVSAPSTQAALPCGCRQFSV